MNSHMHSSPLWVGLAIKVCLVRLGTRPITVCNAIMQPVQSTGHLGFRESPGFHLLIPSFRSLNIIEAVANESKRWGTTSPTQTPDGIEWSSELLRLQLRMPTGRPPSEPPIFDYDAFVEEYRDLIPSTARLKRLFEKDIVLGYRWRDELTALKLLEHYVDWSFDMTMVEHDAQKVAFYKCLAHELQTYLFESRDPVNTLQQAIRSGVVSSLGYWQYLNLDEDGGTNALGAKLQLLEDIDKVVHVFQDT